MMQRSFGLILQMSSMMLSQNLETSEIVFWNNGRILKDVLIYLHILVTRTREPSGIYLIQSRQWSELLRTLGMIFSRRQSSRMQKTRQKI